MFGELHEPNIPRLGSSKLKQQQKIWHLIVLFKHVSEQTLQFVENWQLLKKFARPFHNCSPSSCWWRKESEMKCRLLTLRRSQRRRARMRSPRLFWSQKAVGFSATFRVETTLYCYTYCCCGYVMFFETFRNYDLILSGFSWHPRASCVYKDWCRYQTKRYVYVTFLSANSPFDVNRKRYHPVDFHVA